MVRFAPSWYAVASIVDARRHTRNGYRFAEDLILALNRRAVRFTVVIERVEAFECVTERVK
jgi:hypothetical protein